MDLTAVVSFVKSYGWQLALVALAGIIFVGILKYFNVFEKVDKSKRKYIYFPMSSVVSLGGCIAYLFFVRSEQTHAMTVIDWVCFCIAVVMYTVAVYALYENLGIRSLIQAFFNAIGKNMTKISELIKKAFTKNITTDELKEMALKLGSDTLKAWIEESEGNKEDNPDTKSNTDNQNSVVTIIDE